jgi:UDP-N-acetylglucosamine acyltransferase
MAIHPTAVISPGAVLAEGVEIGPYCVVGEGVRLGAGCRLMHHVSLEGPAVIGLDNVFHPFCSIGGKTQDLKYAGEPTFLEIGDRNTFREFVTVNRGTGVGEKTVVGSDNTFLAYVHIAHNCVVGSHCIFSNNGTLAGHVVVDDHVIIGGLSAVHQFCRLGVHSMVGGCTKIVQDVPPYTMADGNPAKIRSLNLVGLQRRGFTEAQIRALRTAFKTLYSPELNTSQAVEAVEKCDGVTPEVATLVGFVKASQRGIIR